MCMHSIYAMHTCGELFVNSKRAHLHMIPKCHNLNGFIYKIEFIFEGQTQRERRVQQTVCCEHWMLMSSQRTCEWVSKDRKTEWVQSKVQDRNGIALFRSSKRYLSLWKWMKEAKNGFIHINDAQFMHTMYNIRQQLRLRR